MEGPQNVEPASVESRPRIVLSLNVVKVGSLFQHGSVLPYARNGHDSRTEYIQDVQFICDTIP